jgi:hypothetical protein
MRPAAIRRHRQRHGLAGKHNDAVRLDNRVEHKRASGLPLAIAAVAAMDKHWVRRESVTHRAAGATTCQIVITVGHDPSEGEKNAATSAPPAYQG